MSLFDKGDLINKADKPKLEHNLSKLLPETVNVIIPPNSKYVLDGGFLCMKYHGPLIAICADMSSICKIHKATKW